MADEMEDDIIDEMMEAAEDIDMRTGHCPDIMQQKAQDRHESEMQDVMGNIRGDDMHDNMGMPNFNDGPNQVNMAAGIHNEMGGHGEMGRHGDMAHGPNGMNHQNDSGAFLHDGMGRGFNRFGPPMRGRGGFMPPRFPPR